MATLEKLVRTVEALKLHQNPSSVSLDETMSKKDKIAHCVSVTDLLPCLEALALRSEEAIHETLAQAFPSLFSVLGPHSNDNEVRLLLKAFLANVGSPR